MTSEIESLTFQEGGNIVTNTDLIFSMRLSSVDTVEYSAESVTDLEQGLFVSNSVGTLRRQ